jgi:hypothetical protein
MQKIECNVPLRIDQNKIYCLFYCLERKKCYSENKIIPQFTTKDIEKAVLEKFTVGEVYSLWQQAYKKAYGEFPTRNNRPVKGC